MRNGPANAFSVYQIVVLVQYVQTQAREVDGDKLNSLT